ncbi:hypothetical protein EZV62_011011 [Acer yangbiense]|uniref:PGG domain-containing protein n=1 Tax=Acer yangbiense TaxID=1000413 RepID=A0A5C7I424_9ROSI|nr:hypothetical protein EZV62_011011 [Acer yangbiense]
MLYMYHEFFLRIIRRQHCSTKTSSIKSKLPTPKQDVNNTINNLFVVAALIVGAAFAGALQIPFDGGNRTDEIMLIELSSFLTSNVITMNLSITAAFILFLALLLDNNLASVLISVAFLLLELALTFLGSAYFYAMLLRFQIFDNKWSDRSLELGIDLFRQIQSAMEYDLF